MVNFQVFFSYLKSAIIVIIFNLFLNLLKLSKPKSILNITTEENLSVTFGKFQKHQKQIKIINC